MRFILLHKSNAHWEAGAVPGPELIARVGALMGELARAGILEAGEGLRATSQGVRLRFAGGKRTLLPGPFPGENELPAGFSIVRTGSLDEAVEWADQEGQARGDVEMDIRPVTEPWDIGLAPMPEGLTTRRYMVLRKADAASERGAPPTAAQQERLDRLRHEAPPLQTVTMGPSARGRRYKNSVGGISVTDGPFAESKELIAGYILVSVGSLDEASELAVRYLQAVAAEEVDLRDLEEPAG